MLKIRKRSALYYAVYSGIIALGIILDQLTKWLATEFLQPIDKIPLIEGFLHLDYSTNSGMAFSMLSAPGQRWIFLTVSTVLIIVMSAYLYLGMPESRLYAVSVSLIVSGGIGNMIDRIFIGEVTDFIYLRLIGATFNGADSFVCVGAGMLILALILDVIKEAKAKKSQSPEEKE